MAMLASFPSEITIAKSYNNMNYRLNLLDLDCPRQYIAQTALD